MHFNCQKVGRSPCLDVLPQSNAVSLLITSPLGVPLGLCLRQMLFGGVPHFGVFCHSFIAKGVRFGPFQGKVVNASEVKTNGNSSLMWEVNAVVFLGGRWLLEEHLGLCPPWERGQGSNLLAVLLALQYKGGGGGLIHNL